MADPLDKFLPVAIVQLTSHPFLSVGDVDYSAEPFLAKPPVLATLRRVERGVADSQSLCQQRYLRWHNARVLEIMEWLHATWSPTLPKNLSKVPVVIFPEGSIPAELLGKLAKYTEKLKCVTIAGTHTYRIPNPNDYTKLSLCNSKGEPETLAHFERELAACPLPTRSVIPIIFPNGLVFLRLKTILSPAECVESPGVARWVVDGIPKPIEKITVKDEQRSTSLYVHVCSESLQIGSPPAFDVDLYAIPSYNEQGATQFNPIIATVAGNQVPVAYCNDGKYGGSKVGVLHDHRGVYWWCEPPIEGMLPPGDAVLMASVDSGNLAIHSGALNPAQHFHFTGLAPIVANKVNSSSFQIKDFLAGLKPNSLSASQRQDLADYLEADEPSPLYRYILSHIDALIDANNLTDLSMSFLSKACCVSGPSLIDLERTLARNVHSHLLSLRDSHGAMSPIASTISRAMTACAEVAGISSTFNAVDAAWQEIKDVRANSTKEAHRRLTHRLAALVEAFRGTSGWVFLLSGNINEEPNAGYLTVAVSHNTPKKNLDLSLAKNGAMVVHVANTKQGFFSNRLVNELGETVETHYRKVIPTTRSEIAVPVFDINDNVLAVVNIEANYSPAFHAAHIGVMQAETQAYAADLLVLKASQDVHQRFLWHPKSHGWGLTSLLNRLSFRIASSIGTSEGNPLVSCTFWYADFPKNRLYVRGTTRFDYEYISSRALSLDRSLIGKIATNERQGFLESYHDCLDAFARPGKAQRMELRHLTGWAFKIAGEHGNNATAFPSNGVIVVYSYQHAYGHEDISLRSAFSDAIMKRLAEISGRYIGAVVSLQREYGCLEMVGTLSQLALAGYNAGDLVLSMCRKLLRSQVGSAFVGNGETVQCIATTGLMTKEGAHVPPMEAVYSSEGSGLTVALATHPGSALRKFDVADSTENAALGDSVVRINNQYREVYELSESEHRRFLGASSEGTHAWTAVIRLNRLANQMPYIQEDEDFLKALAKCAGSTLCVDAKSRRYSEPSFSMAERRLRAHWPTIVAWNVTFVDAILHDLLVVFEQYGYNATRASVRIRVGQTGDDLLLSFREHAKDTREPPTEAEDAPIVRTKCSGAWYSFDNRVVVVEPAGAMGCFGRPQMQGDVYRLYVPFGGMHQHQEFDGILGIDLRTINSTNWISVFKSLSCAVSKLCMLGLDNGAITRRLVKGLLENDSEISKGVSAKIFLGKPDGSAGNTSMGLRIGCCFAREIWINADTGNSDLARAWIGQIWGLFGLLDDGNLACMRIRPQGQPIDDKGGIGFECYLAITEVTNAVARLVRVLQRMRGIAVVE